MLVLGSLAMLPIIGAIYGFFLDLIGEKVFNVLLALACVGVFTAPLWGYFLVGH